MLAWQLCDLSGDPDQYIAKKPYIFVIFRGGGGGCGPHAPHSGSAHVFHYVNREILLLRISPAILSIYIFADENLHR